MNEYYSHVNIKTLTLGFHNGSWLRVPTALTTISRMLTATISGDAEDPNVL